MLGAPSGNLEILSDFLSKAKSSSFGIVFGKSGVDFGHDQVIYIETTEERWRRCKERIQKGFSSATTNNQRCGMVRFEVWDLEIFRLCYAMPISSVFAP